MKLANLDGRAVLVTDDGGIDIASASHGAHGPDMRSIYDEWDDFVAWARGVEDADTVAIDDSRLRAPVDPRQVFAIGLNYAAHAAESGMQPPSIPATFTKFPASIVGPEAEVTLPSDSVDWEVELVVVIGRRAVGVSAEQAWDHVAGVAIGQDLSERVVQFAAGNQFSLGKSYTGFSPVGPWVVTPDELADRDNLALGCSIDGETVQDARTDDLIFDVPELIAQLSAVLPLLPGDIIFTGTPSGVGMARKPPRFLEKGQLLESWIEGCGRLRTHLV